MKKPAKLTLIDVQRSVARLAVSYPLPKGQTQESVSQVWFEALSGFSGRTVQQGLANLLQYHEGTFWPSVNVVRHYCQRVESNRPASALADRYRMWEMGRGSGPCPVCGADLRELTAEERGAPPGAPTRFGVLHDVNAHREKGIPHVGHPLTKTP